MVAEIPKIEVRTCQRIAVCRHILDRGDAVRLDRAGQRVQQQGMHPTVNSRVGPDTDADGQNCDSGERAAPIQTAKRVTQVLPECAHVTSRPVPQLAYPRTLLKTHEL